MLKYLYRHTATNASFYIPWATPVTAIVIAIQRPIRIRIRIRIWIRIQFQIPSVSALFQFLQSHTN